MVLMTEVLEANIFFFITGIAVIVFTFLASIALYHVIRLLKSARRVVDRIDAGSEIIAGDLDQLRTYITERSFLSRFLGAVLQNENTVHTPVKRSATPLKKVERPKGKTELKIRNEE